MKAEVTISNIYWNVSLSNFFFREQAYKTLDLLMELSAMGSQETLSALDEATEDMGLDDVEEMFYSYSAEDMAREFGIELKEEEDEDDAE